MKKQTLIGPLCLLAAALVWGFGFVAQDMGAEHVEPFTFQAARSLMATLALGALWLIRDAVKKAKGTALPMTPTETKSLLLGGPVCGVILTVAAALQQFGIANNETSPGKEAFITALYIVLVPLLGLLFGKRARPHVYACVVLALFGLWLLCMNGSGLSVGDLQTMACSLVFAFHIIAVGFFSPNTDGVRLSCLQFFTVTVLSAILALLFEHPSAASLWAATPAILYSGIVSAGIGYTLQIIGQRHTPETAASLLMSLESVFAVLASAILLPELTPFSFREGIGMVIILVAIILSQLSFRPKKA